MSEVIRHKRHQSRAFLLLPASFSVAALIGPGAFLLTQKSSVLIMTD